MPVVDSTARYKHLGQGRGKIVIENFDPDSVIDDYRDGLDILVLDRHERPLEFWESPAEDDFLRIVAKNARKRIREFEFEVDSTVVNPMASDLSGEYVLKIKGRNNYILRFVLTARQTEGGLPEANTTYFTNIKREPAVQTQGMDEGYQTEDHRQSGHEQVRREPDHGAHALAFDEEALERRRVRGSRIMMVVGVLCVIGLLAGGALFVMNIIENRVM